jgi:DnaA family protein
VHWALPDLGSRVLGQSQGFALQALPDTAHGAVLAQWAAARGLQLPADTLQYLLARLPRDLGELRRAFDTLDAAAWVAQRRLTVPFVRATLELDREA